MAATVSHVHVREGLSWLQGSWTVFPSKHCQDGNSRVEQAGQVDSCRAAAAQGPIRHSEGHRAMRGFSSKIAEDLFFCSLRSGKQWHPSHCNHGDRFMGGSVCCCFLISPPSLPPSLPSSSLSCLLSSLPPSLTSFLPLPLHLSLPPSLLLSSSLLFFLPSLPSFFHLFFEKTSA